MSNRRPARGLLFVVSSPSGAGKTTLCKRLTAEFSSITFSISYTTRPRRSNEVDGVDYFFVAESVFEEMVSSDRFAEWAVVHGNRYGTARATVDDNLDEGRDLLFDVDWQGATALKTEYRQDTVMVFVLPPSIEELAHRLRNRGTDAPDVVERRLAKATEELGHHGEYRYVVINDAIERAYGELRAIYLAEQCTKRAAFAEVLREEAGRLTKA